MWVDRGMSKVRENFYFHPCLTSPCTASTGRPSRFGASITLHGTGLESGAERLWGPNKGNLLDNSTISRTVPYSRVILKPFSRHGVHIFSVFSNANPNGLHAVPETQAFGKFAC
jgi:hypothetical protein